MTGILIHRMTKKELNEFLNFHWRKMKIISSNHDISEKELSKSISEYNKKHPLKLKDAIKKHINDMYLICDENIPKTARILDISLNTAEKKYGV